MLVVFLLLAASLVVVRHPSAGGRRRGWGDAASHAGPRLELAKAVIADADGRAAWVVVGALVERDLFGGVRVAEDVATTPAVVAPDEVVEVLFACGVVADFGFGIGLFLRGLALLSLAVCNRGD